MKKALFSFLVMFVISFTASAYSCSVSGSKGKVTVRNAADSGSCFSLANAIYNML